MKKPSTRLGFKILGVADGARTHDNRNHNPAAKYRYVIVNIRYSFSYFPTMAQIFSRIHAGLQPCVGKFHHSVAPAFRTFLRS